MEALDPGYQASTQPMPVPLASYARHVPEHPFIRIPTVERKNLALNPSTRNIDPTLLSLEDLRIITNDQIQLASDTASTWNYEQRRQAQQVLDFLWLGPTSVVKDWDFLRREGITMVLVARDRRMAKMRMMSVEKAAAEVGMAVEYADFDDHQQLLSGFPEIIRVINRHILEVHRAQIPTGQQDPTTGQPAIKRGKVLVTCESGNDVSCTIVTAYIMALFGKNMVTAIQFVNMKRFCGNFSTDAKRVLQTWGDLLKARFAVAKHLSNGHVGSQGVRTKSKRRVDEMDMDDEDHDMIAPGQMDGDRFVGRQPFVPFMD